MKDLTLVVMAAGMGSRFGGLKQITPVDKEGNFLIDYSVYDAIKAGFTKVVFIIKEEIFEDFKETIGKRLESKIKVDYAFQKIENVPNFINVPKNRVKPWGTVHAILAAKHLVDTPFVVINADDFYGYDSYKILAEMNDIEEIKKSIIRVQCPECGYKMPISYTEEAECDGVMVFCKGRNCHAVFQLKIKRGKQIK